MRRFVRRARFRPGPTKDSNRLQAGCPTPCSLIPAFYVAENFPETAKIRIETDIGPVADAAGLFHFGKRYSEGLLISHLFLMR
ncbi:MAG: hypothetical protein JOY95_04415 [Silvibacterium sp.]|nr:hypothetical protein [Silvibacterium sp.]